VISFTLNISVYTKKGISKKYLSPEGKSQAPKWLVLVCRFKSSICKMKNLIQKADNDFCCLPVSSMS